MSDTPPFIFIDKAGVTFRYERGFVHPLDPVTKEWGAPQFVSHAWELEFYLSMKVPAQPATEGASEEP